MASGSGKGHFNPRSPHGERRHLYGDLSRLWHFNPRSPHGERRDGSSLSIIDFVFQPTLPARGATKMTTGLRASTFEFQPTLPARGATVSRDVSGRPGANFNPRSPHGERLGLQLAASQAAQFQPTLPARGATRLIVSSRLARRISTHAPRTGSDEGCSSSAGTSRHFNPRSPHGERRHAARLYDGAVRFQSTLPARGATADAVLLEQRLGISIHAPRTGSDLIVGVPCADFEISIHAPRTGSDRTTR